MKILLVFEGASRNLGIFTKGNKPSNCCGHILIFSFILFLCFLSISVLSSVCSEQKKERECMQLRIAVLRSELQRQRKALGREIDLRQKERAQLQKKGKANGITYNTNTWTNVPVHT